MLKRIAQILFLAFIAWLLSDILNVILPLPTKDMVKGFVDFSNPKDVWFFQFLRYIVWIVFLALLFKFTRPFLGFVLPISRRYGTTKPVRRIQFYLSSIVFFILFLMIGVCLIELVAYPYSLHSRYNKLLKDSLKVVEQSRTIERFRNESELNKAMAKDFVKAHDANLYFKKEKKIWPMGNYTISAFLLTNKPYEYEEIRYIDSYLDEEELLLTQEERTELRKKYKPKRNQYSIKGHPIYRDYFFKQKSIKRQWRALSKEMDALLLQDLGFSGVRDSKILIKDYAWNTIKADIGHPFKWDNINKLEKWLTAGVIALLLFLATQYFGNIKLGLFYEKIMRIFQQGRFGLGGSARFAGLFEEWAVDFSYQNQALYMGRSLYSSNIKIGLSDPRHMLTIAGTRAGKGATAIIPNLITWGGSALVIDPKGTNAAVTMRRRENALKQKVHIIDPFNIVGVPDSKRARFNPLELLDINSPSIREQIYIIAEALVVPDQNQKEKHWDDGAKTVIAGLIAHVISCGKYEEPTLYHLRDLISCLPEDQDALWAEMSMNDKAGRLAMDAANRLIRGINTNEISSILSNADKHTEWLSSPAMVKTLGSSSFNFSDMKDEPTTIYLVLPPEYLETHNRFLRLFINLAINQMSVGGRSEVPVLLMLDEFLALGRMEEVEKAFGLMAGYNLVIWPFVQDLGRLKDLYGKSVNAFIANSRAVQVFGINDEETKDYVSKAIGNRKLDKSILGNKNAIETHVKLRDETEVGLDISADSGRQYILRAGKTPLIIEKTPYYKDEYFSGKFAIDPDYK